MIKIKLEDLLNEKYDFEIYSLYKPREVVYKGEIYRS